jgi:hypothetical protein
MLVSCLAFSSALKMEATHSSETAVISQELEFFNISLVLFLEAVCGLVVRVSGYRSRGPELDSRRFQIF